MKELIRIYKELSDESRLRVLNLLFEKECCVCEVEQVLETSQSKASRILTALYAAGLVTFRKEGLWSLYSMDWDGMDGNVKEILEATRNGFADIPQMKADLERLRTVVRVGPCCTEGSCDTKIAPEKILAE